MTPESLSIIAGILLSLAASYLPGFSAWFAALDATYKRLLMLACLAAAAAASFGLACIPGSPLATVTCDQPGAWTIAQAFVAAAIANQTTYLLSPQKDA
jgi:hypothetical protein